MVPTTQVRSGPVVAGAGWFDDPEFPGQKRYWDGARWTDRRVPAPPVAPRRRPPPAPEAGWYDDPTASGSQRYWDGVSWTTARLPVAPASPPPPPPPPPVVAPVAPVAPTPTLPGPAAGWYDDPTASGSQRYWDGACWTEQQWSPPPVPDVDVVAAPPSARVEPGPVDPDQPVASVESVVGEESADTLTDERERPVLEPETESTAEPEFAPAPEFAAGAEAAPEREAGGLEPNLLSSAVVSAAVPELPADGAVVTEAPSPEVGELTEPVAEGQAAAPTSPVAGSVDVPPTTPLVAAPALDALTDRGTVTGVAWYRRRAVWAVAVVLLALVGFGVVRACSGPSGAEPQPGAFEGTGDDGFTIEFTVSPIHDLEDLQFDVPGGAVSMQGSLDESVEVDGGEFDVTLVDGLGLQTLTIEGRFTDGGSAATGSYSIELAPGVEQQSGDDIAISGSWQARLIDAG